MAILPFDINDVILDADDITILPRHYMGYSNSGEPCARKIWYDLHWAYKRKIPARIQRIFDTGHMFEEFMTKTLIGAGIAVHSEQKEVVGQHGHALGHIDGICSGVPGNEDEEHLLELKTMNNKNFKELLNKKVKKSKPGYYAQMTSYMGKLKLKNALFMAYNKNDSAFYYEIVPFDQDHFDYLESRLFDVLVSEFPPEKIGTITWFECKWCDAKDVCHNNAKPEKNCRTCQQGTLEDAGKWTCGGQDELSVKAQEKGCSSWKQLDTLSDIGFKDDVL